MASETGAGGHCGAGRCRSGGQTGPTPEEVDRGHGRSGDHRQIDGGGRRQIRPPATAFGGKRFDVVIAVLPQTAASSRDGAVVGSEGLQLAPNFAPIEIPSLDPPRCTG